MAFEAQHDGAGAAPSVRPPAMHAPREQAPLELVARLRPIADEIGRRWRLVHRDEQAFPDIAAAEFGRLPASLEFDVGAFVRWALASERLPMPSTGDEFGEPPVTVMVGDGFKFDVLFWLDGTTTIHQHMFSGAFRVLAGSSIHGDHRFTARRRINSRLQLGELVPGRTELLRPGDVRPIHPGSGLIHSLFHLERPSVTLVARTPGEDDVRPQFDYLRPGIALDPSRAHPDLLKRVQLLRMMMQIGHPELEDHVLLLLRGADLEATVRMLRQPQLIAYPSVRAWLEAECPHADARALLLPAYDEAIRMAGLVTWRSLLVEPQHRFLLALLMNLSSRGDLLAFVRQRYRVEPAALVMRWIEEIIAVQARCPELAPVIDIPTDEASLAALRSALEAPAAAESEAVSASTAAGLRSSVFLRPLLERS